MNHHYDMAASWVESAVPFVILLAWPGALAIPIMYLFAPWYRSHLGRALMTSASGLGLLVTLGAVRVALTLGDDPPPGPPPTGATVAFDCLRLAVYVLVACGIYYELAVMAILQRRGTDMHTDHEEP